MPDDTRPSGPRPTRLRTLLLAALLGAALTGAALKAVTSFDLMIPTVPWTSPVLLLVGAMAAAALARVTHLRNHVLRQPPDPGRAVAVLAIAKALLLGGALLAGGYVVYALFSVGHLDAPMPRQRLVVGLVSAVASVAVAVAGWFVERACRTPDDEDENADS